MFINKSGNFTIEKTDQCMTCQFQNSCTTMQLLASGMVFLNEEYDCLNFTDCSFYREKMQIVKETKIKSNIKEFKRKGTE